MRRILCRIASMLLILAGTVLVTYPWISNRLYERQVESTVTAWEKNLEEDLTEGDSEKLREEAEDYNRWLASSKVRLTDPFVPVESETTDRIYERMLSSDETGILGFVEIPKI